MSNEVGNMMYSAVLKHICKICTNFEQKQLADFVLEKAPVTKIFNITDPNSKILNDSETRRKATIDKRVDEILGTTGCYSKKEEVSSVLKYSWTPYCDDIFVYAKIGEGDYSYMLAHRLDDNRIITFHGLYQISGDVTIFSIPVSTSINGVELRLHNLLNSLADIKVQQEYANLTTTFTTCFYASILKIFNDIANQEKRSFKCYVDEPEVQKTNYYRKLTGQRDTIKALDKPIILVLYDDNDIENKIKKYRNPHGHIEYAFSWVVRGHYRRLHNPETVGYDRNGEKCVQGMTWVETYLKGDPSLPLLKRETIVIDKRNKNVQGESK